ncbi:unnamed protein product [Closterium sp. Naga37s-1]|nr:unnamed protein product [Closterium sp. Naga37s-1]
MSGEWMHRREIAKEREDWTGRVRRRADSSSLKTRLFLQILSSLLVRASCGMADVVQEACGRCGRGMGMPDVTREAYLWNGNWVEKCGAGR